MAVEVYLYENYKALLKRLDATSRAFLVYLENSFK